jgi:hypothetical protein
MGYYLFTILKNWTVLATTYAVRAIRKDGQYWACGNHSSV